MEVLELLELEALYRSLNLLLKVKLQFLLCLILDKKQGEVHPESHTTRPFYVTGTFKDKCSPDIQISYIRYMGVSTERSTPFQGEANTGSRILSLSYIHPLVQNLDTI